jgi:hypothetical protein
MTHTNNLASYAYNEIHNKMYRPLMEVINDYYPVIFPDSSFTAKSIEEAMIAVGAKIENGILSKRMFFNNEKGATIEFLGFTWKDKTPLFRAFRK